MMNGGGWMRARLGQELDLSSEQRQRIADIRERATKRRIQAMADLRIAAVDLRHLMRADPLDERAIDSQIDRLATMRAGIMKARIGALFEMRSVLTQDQQRKLRELRERGPARGSMRRGGPDRDGDRNGDGDHGDEDQGDGSN
jgi:Spy/CpxP family protein refolding chaperone